MFYKFIVINPEAKQVRIDHRHSKKRKNNQRDQNVPNAYWYYKFAVCIELSSRSCTSNKMMYAKKKLRSSGMLHMCNLYTRM